ncbi:competence type IV pilus major pilin ComGC [Streptococcus sp. sy004]|uniref:competence type IV pilus major pilin ComGC n=1 Tax=Streptococcus sp. sy004 TaxID=2600149 RepID=UPI0028F71307|nr:competence type IV pilus major pilin ComGC [Streptococcus sp. sy004]
MNKLLKLKARGFTLVEMLIVLVIISVLLLLFVPNLSQQKDKIKDTGNAAVVKVVESQAELYELTASDQASLGKLVDTGHITQKQAESYNDYYRKADQGIRKVPN